MIADARAPVLKIVRRIDSVRILKSAGSPVARMQGDCL
jgi:hypothetical protein